MPAAALPRGRRPDNEGVWDTTASVVVVSKFWRESFGFSPEMCLGNAFVFNHLSPVSGHFIDTLSFCLDCLVP